MSLPSAKDGTKSGQSVKNEECHNYNEQVAEQQSGGNIHRGVLFDDHGDDVCPASGGVLEKSRAAAIAGSKIAKQSSSEI